MQIHVIAVPMSVIGPGICGGGSVGSWSLTLTSIESPGSTTIVGMTEAPL